MVVFTHTAGPTSKGCLKLNIDMGFKDGQATLAVLARDEFGLVKDLWFEKKAFQSALEAEAKVLFNACVIAKSQNYVKIIIKSDCKTLVDFVLGYSCCPWSIYALAEDIKAFFK